MVQAGFVHAKPSPMEHFQIRWGQHNLPPYFSILVSAKLSGDISHIKQWRVLYGWGTISSSDVMSSLLEKLCCNLIPGPTEQVGTYPHCPHKFRWAWKQVAAAFFQQRRHYIRWGNRSSTKRNPSLFNLGLETSSLRVNAFLFRTLFYARSLARPLSFTRLMKNGLIEYFKEVFNLLLEPKRFYLGPSFKPEL